MLYLLISCVSFILLSKSFTHKPLQSWEGKLKYFLSIWLWGELSSFLVSWFCKNRLVLDSLRVPISLPLKKMTCSLGSKVENVEEEERISLLDLPELTLECIFERLSPAELRTIAGVCTSLRERCTSDHLWEKHMKQRWGGVLGDAAYREWQCHVASTRRSSLSDQSKKKSLLLESLYNLWPLPWITPKFEKRSEARTTLPVDSIMALYLSLESGNFWFPAQVYNRENGHAGFMLSCYDAQLSYDPRTDTFQARYSPYGRRTTEDNIQWARLRAPPVDTPPYTLHASDCLHDLKPDDHIEIQWRRNKDFPYGWWYGVVGHLESCDGVDNHCSCQFSEMVILEFNQYTPGSRWRRTVINRKKHREEGNEADGFYGGIRKLYHEEEITSWKRRWPARVLE